MELDNSVIRYYEQPINVPISTFDNNSMEVKMWYHVPDVLVFRSGHKPHLYQIKGMKKDSQSQNILKACLELCANKNWDYSIVYPKELPEILKSNVILLWNFSKKPKNFEFILDEVLFKVQHFGEIKIEDLAKSFTGKIDFRFVLPLIYHLIFKGDLYVNLMQPINNRTIVKPGNITTMLSDYYIKEVVN
ncbi:TnsA endonuclease N-terminal domain-containing protein [Bacillus sp. E214]|uniref:TnsA endonuclease N-terminal domain-containing protein n=1 Tax=Bacillus sp. E214 TaxID=2587156 RepID=UPI001651F6DD|nr:TnsA endonuclease N-terminal domain-containing protein [Bacillus sp. E214]